MEISKTQWDIRTEHAFSCVMWRGTSATEHNGSSTNILRLDLVFSNSSGRIPRGLGKMVVNSTKLPWMRDDRVILSLTIGAHNGDDVNYILNIINSVLIC